MDEREYGELVVTPWLRDGGIEQQVDRADPVVLLSLERLQRMHVWRVSGDRIWVGVDLTGRPPTRRPVWYRVAGWDADRHGLIIERVGASPTSEDRS